MHGVYIVQCKVKIIQYIWVFPCADRQISTVNIVKLRYPIYIGFSHMQIDIMLSTFVPVINGTDTQWQCPQSTDKKLKREK